MLRPWGRYRGHKTGVEGRGIDVGGREASVEGARQVFRRGLVLVVFGTLSSPVDKVREGRVCVGFAEQALVAWGQCCRHWAVFGM